MYAHSSLDGGRANSLVFTFTEQLDSSCTAPEPVFEKWMESWLVVDVGYASDEAAYAKLAKEEREAWKLFYDAAVATRELLALYKRNLMLFQNVARHLMFLPGFLSWHPENQQFNCSYLKNSNLSLENLARATQPKGPHMARQSWPVRYAYAIIFTIDLNLDTYDTRLPEWAELYGYGVKHPIPMAAFEARMDSLGWEEAKRQRERPKLVGHYRILPAWTRGLVGFRRPLDSRHVLDYWRVGKQMILEEMPDFHLRPEWQKYETGRGYQHGAKTGAVQHAIFKDILSALKTIAKAGERWNSPGAAK